LEQAARELAAIGDRFGQAVGQSYLGLVFELAGEVDIAAQYFAEACAQLDDVGARGFAADARTGLARNSLQSQQLKEAQQQVNEVWEYLQQHGPQGLEFPMRAYLTCAEVFTAGGAASILPGKCARASGAD
jgi:hypothetical protein